MTFRLEQQKAWGDLLLLPVGDRVPIACIPEIVRFRQKAGIRHRAIAGPGHTNNSMHADIVNRAVPDMLP